MPSITRGTLQVLIVTSLIAVCVLSSAFEPFDHWDKFPQSGHDIVLSIVAFLAMLGMVLLAVPALVVLLVLKFVDLARPCLPAGFASLVRSNVGLLEPTPSAFCGFSADQVRDGLVSDVGG